MYYVLYNASIGFSSTDGVGGGRHLSSSFFSYPLPPQFSRLLFCIAQKQRQHQDYRIYLT